MIFDEKEQRQTIKYLNISNLFKGASLKTDKVPWFSGTSDIEPDGVLQHDNHLGRLYIFLKSENSSTNTRAGPMAMHSLL